jgi:branched-chain amino acid transport system substrate-binding protein
MRFLLQATFIRVPLLVAIVLFFVYSPYDFKIRAQKNREQHTQQAATPMEIAVVWPRNNHNFFIEGAEMAVREINERGGVIIEDEQGYPVPAKIVMHEFDEDEFSSIKKMAEHVASNPNLSAVIGHSTPDSAILASVTYHDNGLLYISPSVADSRLTQLGFWSTVRTIPADTLISRALVSFALERGWKKAAILNVRNTYGATYANQLRAWMGELHARPLQDTNQFMALEPAYQEHYGPEETSFYLMISALLKQQFDVLFLADSMIGDAAPRTLALIGQLREMGVTQPILGTEEIHSKYLWPTLGQKANGIFAVNIFDLQGDKSNRIAARFRLDFRTLYTNLPTMQGSKSYEAVQLLAQAAERARSKLPIKMATMFRSTSNWNGLQGEGAYDFDLDGGIQRKRMILEQMQDGTFIRPTIPQLCQVYTNKIDTATKKRRD